MVLGVIDKEVSKINRVHKIIPEQEMRAVMPIEMYTETTEEIEKKYKLLTDRQDMNRFLKQKGFANLLNLALGEVFLNVARLGYVNVIKFLESNQYNMNYTNSFGDTLLHFAVRGDSYDTVQYLLLRGINPNRTNNLLMTPLFYAIEEGNVKASSLLLNDKRTRFDHTDKFGETILHYAARDGNVEIIKMILAQTERIARMKNQMGQTAL